MGKSGYVVVVGNTVFDGVTLRTFENPSTESIVKQYGSGAIFVFWKSKLVDDFQKYHPMITTRVVHTFQSISNVILANAIFSKHIREDIEDEYEAIALHHVISSGVVEFSMSR